MKYRPEVDGLRALSIIPVILFHANIGIVPGGFLGVDVFFVISGFLITLILLQELGSGNFNLIRFYERRARRILPALFFVILICLPFALAWFSPRELTDFSNSVFTTIFSFSNFYFWLNTGYFDVAAKVKPLLHTWSLSVEEQFYLVFPVSFFFIWKFARKLTLPAIGVVAIISLGLAEWGAHNSPSASFFFPVTRAWELALGAICAILTKHHLRALSLPALIRELTGVLGLAALISSFFIFDSSFPLPGLITLIPTIGTAGLLLYATDETLAGRILSVKPLVWIGLISYSAYLWHQPILAFARFEFDIKSPEIMLALATLSLPVAYLSWRYVEQPFRNRQTVPPLQLWKVSGISAVLLITFSATTSITDGFLFRYDGANKVMVEHYNFGGNYVVERFNKLRLKPFGGSAKPKVLVVGDSFSQDLTNAIFESGVINKIQLSTHYIPARCGIVYLEKLHLDLIPEKDRKLCQAENKKGTFFTGKDLQNLLLEADHVWLSSSWAQWSAEKLPETLERLEREFGKKPLVFGTKRFGKINIDNLLSLKEEERKKITNHIPKETLNINRIMKNTLPKYQFIDILTHFCPDMNKCKIFNEDGFLYSYDGSHLTEYGAHKFGTLLKQHPLVQKQLQHH